MLEVEVNKIKNEAEEEREQEEGGEQLRDG